MLYRHLQLHLRAIRIIRLYRPSDNMVSNYYQRFITFLLRLLCLLGCCLALHWSSLDAFFAKKGMSIYYIQRGLNTYTGDGVGGVTGGLL